MSRVVSLARSGLGLALRLPDPGMPEILGFGAGADHAVKLAARASRINGMDVSVPSAVLLPTGGMGFFGWPAISGHRNGSGFVQQFGNWRVEQADDALTLHATDDVARLALTIGMAITEGGTLAIQSRLRNVGADAFALERCMAGSMLVDDPQAELLTFSGSWGREFQIGREKPGSGLWLKESRRGRTSHDRSPSLMLETRNSAWGLHLGWSGNHVMAVDRLDDGRLLVHAGELFEPGEIILAPGESYESPKLYMARDASIEDVSRRFHTTLLRNVLTFPDRRSRPVTLNTWEGNYFDHRLDALKAQASAAADLGIERFVLDDGWFGRRDDDTTSLGDWAIDPRKYPQGLKPLVDHVTGLGMEFGIWFEPEMVNPDSDLYRAHPDWVLQVKGRPLLLSRNQLVLDLTRAEVSEYLFHCMDEVLRDHAISYIKWDMNRDLTHAGDAEGRAATARQTRAVYALMDLIRKAHPHVEIESCASGGGRADYGVLAHTHRIWTSDCTDALERLEIQRGARLFFSPQILGAHVSAAPNHQTHRRHTLSFRALVALAYHFGVELDPTSLSGAEGEELKGWIALHKRLRPLFHTGDAFHQDPQDGRYVWGAMSDDHGVAIVAQGPMMMTEQPPPLVIPAFARHPGTWRISAVHPVKPDFIRISDSQSKLLSGAATMPHQAVARSGLPFPMLRPEQGAVIEFERV